VTLGNPSPQSSSQPHPQWQAQPQLWFFDENGKVVESFDPKLPIGSPQVTPLGPVSEEVSSQRLLFSTAEGIASLSASADKTVLPDAYPYQSLHDNSFYRIVPISGMTDNPLGDGILVLYGYTVAEETGTVLIGAETSKFITTLTRSAQKLVGKLLAANIDSRLSSPCSEFIFAYQETDTVYALDPCDSKGKWQTLSGEPNTAVRLNEGHVVAENLLSSDLNNDGQLDLVLGDETGQVYVTFGLGDGRFTATPAQPDATLGRAFPLSVTHPDSNDHTPLRHFPLAIGDLNADDRDDWVLPDGILLTDTLDVDPSEESVNLVAHASNQPFVGRWAVAQLGDFNRDNLLDLVAAASDEPNLDFFLGTGLERMNRFGLATEGIVTQLTTGDYDGDLTQDLAYNVTAEPSSSNGNTDSDTLYVAFGNLGSIPTVVTAIGSFHDVRQLSSAHYVSTDAISELGVISHPETAVGEELSVYIGNAGRHPIAPLGLSIMTLLGEDYWATPLAVVAGRFEKSDARSAVAIGLSCSKDQDDECRPERAQYRFWYIASNAYHRLSQPLVSSAIDDEFSPLSASSSEYVFQLVSGDTDNDNLDELLLLATNRDTPDQVTLWPVTVDPTAFSLDPDALTTPRSLLGQVSSTPGTLFSTSNPTLLDLNRDNYQDLAFLVRNDNGDNELLVAWNDGHGNLTLSDAVHVSLDDEPPLGIYGRSHLGQSRLFAVTAKHVFEISPAEEGTHELSFETITNTLDESIPGGNAVTVGDLTGDGLLDVVVAARGTVRFFAEKAAEP
jgi:hypothetical protein